ncbi:MAG: adenylyl-sulfate kinase [Acidimicrobiia bacterium]|nr:adenylyl-sulfate kinase [Acidimicrobiia bacterium]
MVIWITGLSGAGKTTLCTELYRRLKPSVRHLVQLDGDAFRDAFNDLGHTEPERFKHISRVQRMAKLLADQDLVVLVGVVYANPELLAWNRANLPGYVEVYLQAPFETVVARDSKGLYARALRGEIRNVVGVDIPWVEPVAPDLTLDGSGTVTISALADLVQSVLPDVTR